MRACFLSQQCVEKYLKARLQEASVAFQCTHDLEILARQLSAIEPGVILLTPALKQLSAYAVIFRYPGHSALRRTATEALKFARQVRILIRNSQGLPQRAAPRCTDSAKTRRQAKTKRGT
jgi:HEPN domain-containing protein